MLKNSLISTFRYPGGKAKLRTRITEALISKYKDGLEYREPFFGGGSIGLNFLVNSDVKKMWLNDKDIGIACLWTTIIRKPEELKKLIKDFVPSVDLFYTIQKELKSIAEVPENDFIGIGFKKLAIHQISYSGLGTMSGGPLGGQEQKSAYKIDCRWSPKYLCKKIDLISSKLNSISLRENKCTNYDFDTLIKDETCESLAYLDPPYYVKGNQLYQCGFSNEDHVRLAQSLRDTKHEWLLSYDDCKEVRELYSWGKVIDFTVNYSITSNKDVETGKRISNKKSEVLIIKV